MFLLLPFPSFLFYGNLKGGAAEVYKLHTICSEVSLLLDCGANLGLLGFLALLRDQCHLIPPNGFQLKRGFPN